MKEIPAKITIIKHHERIFNIETPVLTLEGYSHLCPFLVVGTDSLRPSFHQKILGHNSWQIDL